MASHNFGKFYSIDNWFVIVRPNLFLSCVLNVDAQS